MVMVKRTRLFLLLVTLSITGTFSAFAQNTNFKQLYQNGNFVELIEHLEKIDKKQFTSDMFTYYVYSLSRQDLDDAEEAAEKALEFFPDNADMYLMHADIMGQQAQDSIFSALGYAEKALNSLQKAAELEPNDPKYLSGLMSFYLAAPSFAGGDTDLALEQAQAIYALDKEQGSAAMARYHQAVDNNDEAMKTLQEGLKEFPESIALYSQLSSFHLNNDDHKSAINTLLKASSVKIEKPDEQALSDDKIKNEYENKVAALLNSHYQIGRIALVGEVEMETGIEHLNKYLSLYDQVDVDLSSLPSKEWAYLRRSGLLYKIGNIKEASDSIAMIKSTENDQMKKIHKSLNKKIKKALKKTS